MLSKKDKAEIRLIIQEELKDCFGRTVQMEKGPRKQGDPEVRVETEDIDIVSALLIYLPRIEAALRGTQEDVDQTKNRVNAMGEALIAFEAPLAKLAKVQALLESNFMLTKKEPNLISGVTK